MITEIVIILVLILFNGVLSASEIAIVSSRKARLQAASAKSPGAKAAIKLKENPNQFLSTIQIGITLIGILTGFFSGGVISSYLSEIFNQNTYLAPYSDQLSIILVVFVITYLSLVIGELVPKRLGMAIPERYSAIIAIPMTVLSQVVKPFVWLLSISTDFLVKLLNIKVSKNTVTEEEIKALVDEGVDSGVIEGFEHDLVDRLLNIGDKRAINMMVHRSDITYLDLENTFEENKKNILESEHTEYPVCDGNFDNIKGIVHTKTLLKSYINGTEIELEKLVQPIPFVNENSSIYNVLEILKNAHVLQAIVIDEYGSPQGIITMKDILAGLVGSYDNANEPKNKLFRQREDGSFIIDGRYQLDDFFEKFEIELSDEDEEEIGNITTVGGLVFLLLDHVPIEGEVITFKGYRFEVIDMDGNRIDKIAFSTIKDHNSSMSFDID
ncbi:hemolysin family protein [Sphingobacterium lumbrici]|uniref:hemolysin family protein n=1 Tax=Sphingobacterium lumbrici TaxID=2559600 RepID=UPI001128237B|nr:hemolysin family protein [Sphingobacterium lumbrici]